MKYQVLFSVKNKKLSLIFSDDLTCRVLKHKMYMRLNMYAVPCENLSLVIC